MRSLWLLLPSLVLLAACGQDGHVMVTAPSDPGRLFNGAGEKILATVNGWKITDADLSLAHPVREGASPRESLDALIDRVLVVQEAVQTGVTPRFAALNEWRKALARAWLARRFLEEFKVEQIPESVWRDIYHRTIVRFDHVDTFFVTDAQYVCCYGAVKDCSRKEVAACQNEKQPIMDRLHEVLDFQKVHDVQAFKDTVRQYALTWNSPIAIKEYSFQYDFSKPHDRQGGYALMNENVARAAKATEVGKFSPVVRSNHGLHILTVTKFLPEIHRKFEDPGVQEELRQSFGELLRQKEVVDVLNELVKKQDFQIHEEALDNVSWPVVSGLANY